MGVTWYDSLQLLAYGSGDIGVKKEDHTNRLLIGAEVAAIGQNVPKCLGRFRNVPKFRVSQKLLITLRRLVGSENL